MLFTGIVTFVILFIFTLEISRLFKESQKEEQENFKLWPTRPLLVLSRVFYFPDGRTDTMCETNDHLFGHRGLVGQKEEEEVKLFSLQLWNPRLGVPLKRSACGKTSLVHFEENSLSSLLSFFYIDPLGRPSVIIIIFTSVHPSTLFKI